MAKTTGTLPRIIDTDGKEIAIVRDQRPNIIEQIKILRYIERWKPRAIVIECMAILPEYQWICERQMIRSHVGVITNCRLDHVNEMGHFREQITRSLGNTIPRGGVLFTSEKTNLHVLKEIGEEQGTKVVRVGGKDVTREELERFGHIENPANVGLSLAVCEWAGVDRETALEGMYKPVPDAGALRVALCREGSKELVFVNALAANDPESTLEIWHQIRERYAPLGKVIILLNSRADRQDRSIQLIEMVLSNIDFDFIVLTGEKTQRFMMQLASHQVSKEKSIGLGWMKPEKVYQILFDLIEGKGTILAIGNVGAGGLDLFRYFYRQRIFLEGVSCPHCGHSMMDQSRLIDGFPSIGVVISFEGQKGWLGLSNIYGSYNIELKLKVPQDAVVRMFCPYCHAELVSTDNCPECGTPMVLVTVSGGRTAHICPRRGCKGHLLNMV